MSLQSQISSLATRIGQECKALWTAVNGKITGANVPANETDPVVGAINGIVKADGAGNISAAVAETDYASPASDEALDLSSFPNPHNWEKDYSPATKNAIGNFLYDIYNDYLTAVSFGVNGDRRTFITERKAGSPAISIMPRASASIDGYMSPTHYTAVEDYIELEVVSQAEAEAGTATTARKWTAERVKQAIEALASAGGASIAIDDTSPDATTESIWFQPTTAKLAVSVDGQWVLVNQVIDNLTSHGNELHDVTFLTSYTETDPVVGAINGITKADGAGNISAATAGSDYGFTIYGTSETPPSASGFNNGTVYFQYEA